MCFYSICITLISINKCLKPHKERIFFNYQQNNHLKRRKLLLMSDKYCEKKNQVWTDNLGTFFYVEKRGWGKKFQGEINFKNYYPVHFTNYYLAHFKNECSSYLDLFSHPTFPTYPFTVDKSGSSDPTLFSHAVVFCVCVDVCEWGQLGPPTLQMARVYKAGKK